MVEWDDELFEELEQKRTQLAAEKERQRREESIARGYAQDYFNEILEITQREIYRLDHKHFGNRRELSLNYRDNTITGDHFLIKLGNVTMAVEFDSTSMEISYETNVFVGDLRTSRYLEVPEHSGLFKMRVVDNKFNIFYQDEPITLEKAAQILLAEIIKAREEWRNNPRR